jgi:sugar O-acyltransferase (sialic acid O-acetyltransferase NeuD family)
VSCCIDADPAKTGTALLGIPVRGLPALRPAARSRPAPWAVVAIGANAGRAARAREMERLGYRLAVLVHPHAVVAPDVRPGAGTVVMAGVVVNAGCRIGRNVILNTGATVDHDCVIEDGAHVAPGCHLAGCVRVGREALVGVGSCAIPGVTIGARSVVGAGSAVIRPVPAGATVAGTPARLLRKKTPPDSF